MRGSPQAIGRPIRLVQFTRAFYLGGTEVQVVELLRGLSSGYQTQVAVLDEAGPLLSSVVALGLRPVAFPLKGSLAQANTPWQVMKLAWWLREQRAEVLHVHDFSATLLAVPAARLAGCKVVVGRLDLAHWHGKARRAALTGLTRAADHVVANADAIRDMLVREEDIPPERISVVRNGLDVRRFDERAAVGLKAPLPDTGGAPVVVHVANMNHPVKRQEDLMVAVARLNQEGTRLHAFLVGDGPRRPELEALAGKLGMKDRIHFLGHRTDVPALYGRATLGVLCSTAEGLSNAIMEGMAASLPMVVTRAGGNPELIAHRERGLVVSPRQPAELAGAFKRILEDPKAARRMGRSARSFVERELSLEQMVAAHDAVYRGLVETAQPRLAVAH